MSDEIEVTERGEIVAEGEDGVLWADPGYVPSSDEHPWHVYAERDVDGVTAQGHAVLCPSTLAAWCRRVLREIEGGARGGDEAE